MSFKEIKHNPKNFFFRQFIVRKVVACHLITIEAVQDF